jgi:60 kDa SS-A/Ro ribonucleoprotein
MATAYSRQLGKKVPQSEPLPGQVKNSAGGHSFPVDDWTRLRRFLILGSEGGSYYASERKLTLDNAACVVRCAQVDGLRVVREVVAVSDEGRAPQNDPALLALAIAVKHGQPAIDARRAAYEALPKVARIGTHLFHFVEYLKLVGQGWGRSTRRAFRKWYLARDTDKLAMQAVKYQARDGWSHRDILRLAHPKTDDAAKNAVLRWMVKGLEGEAVSTNPVVEALPSVIAAFEAAKLMTKDEDKSALCHLITGHSLPHECVPNEMKGHAEVWDAMLPHMGLTALIRNLGKMTSIGLLKPLSKATQHVVSQLGDIDLLRKARIHPLNVLTALKIYGQGHGDKGNLSWTPVQQIVDALDGAFYSAFKAVEPTGKRHMLAVDISGSMDGGRIAGGPLTPREGAAAMSLVTANVEPVWAAYGFCTRFEPLKISARSRLDDVVNYMRGLRMGGTDCAQPMVWAAQNKVEVDTFVVYTDSETWAGSVHPPVALKEYRQKMGIPAKLIVVGMVSNGFSIADPNDGGMLDVVGFDSAAPAVMADFTRD